MSSFYSETSVERIKEDYVYSIITKLLNFTLNKTVRKNCRNYFGDTYSYFRKLKTF